jgi:YidC/Oxa1 family membrane protein insertase
MDSSVRFVVAIILMVAVILITNLIFPPARPQVGQHADSVAAGRVAPSAVTGSAPPAQTSQSQPTTTPNTQTTSSARTVVIESPLYRYAVSSLGGTLISAELLKFPSFTRKGPVQLVGSSGALVAYRLKTSKGQVIDLRQLPFQVQPQQARTLGNNDTASMSLHYSDPAGGFNIDMQYRFRGDNYVIDVAGRVGAPTLSAPELFIEMGPTLAVNEATPTEDYRALAYVVNSDRTGIRTSSLDAVKTDQIEEGPLQWVALKNKYFLAVAMSSSGDSATKRTAEPFGGLIARNNGIAHAADMTTTLPLRLDSTFSFSLYVGPQEFNRLAALGREVQDVNPYGWRVFRPIVTPVAHAVMWAVLQLHRVLGLGYGWVLILFGVLVRIVLWPLNAKAMRSQLKNMEIQPKLKEIQDRYKSDPEKMQKEVMKLYREEGFNPLGGCLPMLIPFPVLLTLYFVFQGTIEFRGVPFLWLPDLSRADPYYILPIILGASMFALQWLSMRSTPNPNQQMKMMTYFMPLFMTMIFLKLASGLNLYYASSNLASIPQQLQIMRERKQFQARKETGVKVR